MKKTWKNLSSVDNVWSNIFHTKQELVELVENTKMNLPFDPFLFNSFCCLFLQNLFFLIVILTCICFKAINTACGAEGVWFASNVKSI